MNLVLGGLCEPYIVTGGFGGGASAPAVAQTFRKALRAKLLSLADLTAIVGTHVYPDVLPSSHDLGTKGPAVVYSVMKSPLRFSGHGDFNHVLSGSDGTITALVILTALSYSFSEVDAITAVLFDEMDGIRNASDWGDGTTTIMSCIHGMEMDQPESPTPENPRIAYRISSQYYVRYRVTLPVNS